MHYSILHKIKDLTRKENYYCMKNLFKSLTTLILCCFLILVFALPVSAEKNQEKLMYTERFDEGFEKNGEIFIEDEQDLGTFEFMDPDLVGTSVQSHDSVVVPFFWFRQAHKIEPTRYDHYKSGVYQYTSVSIKSLGYTLSHVWKH